MRDPRLTRRTVIVGSVAVAASHSLARSAGTTRDVRQFGARGDGIADDREAIQRGIDEVHAVGGGVLSFPAGTYRVTHRVSPDGNGLAAIVLRSGVTLQGVSSNQAVIRLADAQLGRGSFARIVSSTSEIEDAAIRNMGFDGNRAGQGDERDAVNGAIVLLGWGGRCLNVTIDGNAFRGANGQAIQLVGSIHNVSRNLRITRNRVQNCSFIGIQAAQFDGLLIERNDVSDTGDNGIDIYGDDTNGGSSVSTSGAGVIRDNRVMRCRLGIFLETVTRIHAAGNQIVGCRESGFRVNRIHGEPRDILIEKNDVTGGERGVTVGGDTGGVIIRDNDFRGFTDAGLAFEYNVSNVTATANRFAPAAPDTPIVLGIPTANSGKNGQPRELLSHISIHDNVILGRHDVARRFVSGYQRSIGVVVDGFSQRDRAATGTTNRL